MTLPAHEADDSLMNRIISQSPVGIAVIDADGIYVTVNPAYCATYGYAEDEMRGNSFLRVFAPAQQERILSLHQRFLTAGGELKGEWEVVRRDGATLSIISESVRVPGPDGRACRLVYVVDITPRKQIELALRRSEHHLQSVLDGLTAHICVLDEVGVVVTVNRAWREFAIANGGPADRVLEGANYLQVCERAARSAAPDGREAGRFLGLLHEVLAGRRAEFQLDYACHAPDEERWFVARVAHIEGSDPPRIVIAHDQVTELKQVQEALREREAALLDLTASIPGAMFRLVHHADGAWRFAHLSPGIEALFELTPAQAYADIATLLNRILPADRPAYAASAREAIQRGGTWKHEFRIRTRSGRRKWIHAEAEPKRGEQGEVIWTGVLTDVSDRKHTEAALQASETTYRTLFETVSQGVVYHDTLGHIVSANPAAERILGLPLAELRKSGSMDPRWQMTDEDGQPLAGDQVPAMRALKTAQPVSDVVMRVHVGGRGWAWLLVNATPLFSGGRLSGVYTNFEDITERVQLSRELTRQATTDYLTGAANRRHLMERLNSEFERMRRHPDLHASVLALDLDHFKQVNDQWGHAAGDAVLVHVTQLMRQETRQLDMVGRSGGEEFTLLLPDTGADEAMALAERLRLRVQGTPTPHDRHQIPITISIGVSEIAAADAGTDAVLARADRALYEAKSAGRNAVRLGPVQGAA